MRTNILTNQDIRIIIKPYQVLIKKGMLLMSQSEKISFPLKNSQQFLNEFGLNFESDDCKEALKKISDSIDKIDEVVRTINRLCETNVSSEAKFQVRTLFADNFLLGQIYRDLYKGIQTIIHISAREGLEKGVIIANKAMIKGLSKSES